MDETLDGFLDNIDAIDEEDLLRMDESEQELNVDEVVPTEATSESVEQQPQQTATTAEVAQPKGEEKGNALKTTAEAALAIPTGTLDWGISLYNKVMPGEVIDIPNIPEFENDVTQSIREISSVVVPTIFITKGLGAAGTAAHTKVGWKLGADPFVKWLGRAGVAGLGGVTADAIAPVQEKDHNALGTLKQHWPQTYSWVSDDWATLDDDEPDVKRKKNIMEGLGIGFAADVLVGAGKLAKSLKGVDKATQWVPENEKAKSIINAMNEPSLADDPLEDAVLKSAKRRYDQTTELGDVKFDNAVNLDEPILGRHDVYEYYESGTRTGDPSGIFGASVDVLKINKNIDTINGRVGSVATSGAIDYIVDGNDAGHKLITTAADLLKDSKYGYKASNGKYLSHEEIVSAGEVIAADLYKMDLPEMKNLIKSMSGEDVSTGARVLTDEAYAGVMQALKKYSDDYINMDIARAQAYISSSFAGQISDMAEGARLFSDNIPATQRAQDQILDRMQYLMQIKATTSYARGRALNMLNLWNRTFKKSVPYEDALTAIKNEENLTKEQLKRIKQKTKNTIDTVRAVKAERPELLKPLMLAYEVTDGKVDSITALNNYIQNTTGVFKKALVDGRPDMPSAWTQGMWANIYNSVLSSFSTPIKAGASNLALMIERPIATFAGALLNGDTATLRRGSYMYTVGMIDTLQQARKHMNQVFRRASDDPSSVGYIMREDIARKNEDTMKVLRSFANASEQSGDFGPSVIVNQIEAMNDMAESPWLRFSANAMTAFDGFTRSFVGSVEARGRAYDQLFQLGGNKAINAEDVKKLGKGLYDQMFDKNGFITDKAVEHASREIAMNLNSKSVDDLSRFIQRYPLLKPFLMFPKTSMNMLQFTGSHNPLGLFVRDWNAFKHPFDHALASGANIEELLTSRGIPFDSNAKAAYETIRAELKGRKAIGTLTVLGAVGLFTTNRLHGNGLYDKTRQRTRREAGWKPRSYKGWDGKWYSYENLGPISDWLAITADIMDNFDTLDEPTIETQLNKLGFLISANLTNKSFTAGLEPLNDVLAGNPAAMSRWGASFGSGLVPLSGMRNELGRLIQPQLKEVDQELGQLVANRNLFAKNTLPNLYDWIDGGLVGEPENIFTRFWNTYSPWLRVSDRISPEKQFLIDIEWDGRPQLRTNGKGVEYTPDQRSQVTELMGRSGFFKAEIKRIMNSIDGKQFRKEIKASGNVMDRELYKRIHIQLDRALNRAKGFAENRISEKDAVQSKLFLNKRIEHHTKRGEQDKVQELLQMYK